MVAHEEFRESHVIEIMTQIKDDGCQIRPIAVSDLKKFGLNKYLIHDGHHRTESLKRLGMKRIAANVIEFSEKKFAVKSWANDKRYTKDEIIEYALQGKKFPPQTTKNVIIENGKERPFLNNDEIEPQLYVKLSELK